MKNAMKIKLAVLFIELNDSIFFALQSSQWQHSVLGILYIHFSSASVLTARIKRMKILSPFNLTIIFNKH